MRTLKGYLKDKAGPTNIHVKTFSLLAPHLKTVVTAPSEYCIPEFLPCFDQEDWGSCVCNAWVGALEILKGIAAGNNTAAISRLSIAWLYFQCRQAMNTVNEDSGTFPYLAADRLMKVGVVPDTTFPYTAANLPPAEGSPPSQPAHPSTELYVEASDNKITGAFKISDSATATDRLSAIETAVRANHPVVWGGDFNVTALSNWTPSVGALDVPGSTDGGHSTVITGVRRFSTGKRWFRVRNSWSPQWGDNGYFWITDDYLASAHASDFWVGTVMQDLVT